jgi:hypothetical protein
MYARVARALAPFIVTGITDHPAWAQRERSTGVRLSDATALAARFPDMRVACFPRNTEASNGQPLWEVLPAPRHRRLPASLSRIHGALPAVERGPCARGGG